jgi:phosphopantetheinyl transferase
VGDLPDIVNALPPAISFAPPPFFKDHHVNGRPVLPAVEAMELLVTRARRHFPASAVWVLKDIRFEKFLFLDNREPPAALARITPRDDGTWSCTLTTRFTSPGVAITRTLSHAALTLARDLPPALEPPMEMAACLTGGIVAVDPDRIYREMVPFGPAYRNIRRLLLSPDGALARVGSPGPPDPRKGFCLGSPYVLDAAFHAACVWCQRFGNTVAFPVAMQYRAIVRPTRLDQTYTARIVPVRTDESPFVFDIFICDDGGRLCEAGHHVRMRDISGGRNTPPPGFHQPGTDDPLAPLRHRVAGLVLLEREAVADFAAAALSENEQRRLVPMTPNRAQGYLSARLALKRLSRRLSGVGDRRQAHAIETVAEDGRAPQCPLADGTYAYCSVAHDRRFTVAVAADRPVGVDVEPLPDNPLGAPDLFMDAAEQALVEQSSLGRTAAAIRVWSAKEAVAKATGRDLADIWQRVRARRITTGESRLIMDGNGELTAWHALMEGHLFTLLAVERR